jgi:hypothetical protein
VLSSVSTAVDAKKAQATLAVLETDAKVIDEKAERLAGWKGRSEGETATWELGWGVGWRKASVISACAFAWNFKGYKQSIRTYFAAFLAKARDDFVRNDPAVLADLVGGSIDTVSEVPAVFAKVTRRTRLIMMCACWAYLAGFHAAAAAVLAYCLPNMRRSTIPDLVKLNRIQAEKYGIDPELCSYMYRKVLFRGRVRANDLENIHHTQQWITQNRPNWSEEMTTDQTARVVTLMKALSPSESWALRLWSDQSFSGGAWKLDDWLKRGRSWWGTTYPQA